jgi:hypothetical protein
MKENFKDFIQEFSSEILPIYEKHEESFDKYEIHSRLHIARSIIFAEYMAEYYEKMNKKAGYFDTDIDFDTIRYAVSFHDSGRKGNGVDLWEDDSYKMCYEHMRNIGYTDDYCDYTSSLIYKDASSDINKDVVYDADVLEIMRPVCGHGGRLGFREKYLRFSESTKNDLIEDAWKLIEYSEDNKQLFNNNNHLSKLLEIIEKYDYKVLKDIL